MSKAIKRVAIIGTGVIGASWAALFLAKGLKVVATDISPNAKKSLEDFTAAAWPALKQSGLAPNASLSNLRFTENLDAAVTEVDLVQENGPERVDFKKDLYRRLDGMLAPEVIIASSSSGITMSEIQSACPTHPERCVIGHPWSLGPADTSDISTNRQSTKSKEPSRKFFKTRPLGLAVFQWTCQSYFSFLRTPA
jgi:3-hydroxyacyl-CoA dehydrogenase